MLLLEYAIFGFIILCVMALFDLVLLNMIRWWCCSYYSPDILIDSLISWIENIVRKDK